MRSRRQPQTDDRPADPLDEDRPDLDEMVIEFVDGTPQVLTLLESDDPRARPKGDDAQLRDVLQPPADRLLQNYYYPGGPFAGESFDALGANDPDRVGSDDLLAVTMLDIRVRPRALRRLLGPCQEQIAERLAALPTYVDLWDIAQDHHAAIDNADQWLRGLDGFGPVAASKLLARSDPAWSPSSTASSST